MRKFTISMALVLAVAAGPSAQQADPVKAAAGALGAGALKTLQFTGSGANFSVGQNFTPAEPWPRVAVKSYTASINYDTGSMRQELVREMGTTMPRGGGAPFTGEQRQNQVVSGNYAWNLGAPAQPGGQPPAARSSECSSCGPLRKASSKPRCPTTRRPRRRRAAQRSRSPSAVSTR